MKLTIEHLKGYLGTNLEYKDIPSGFDGIRILNIYTIDWCLENGKPILYPLSTITKYREDLGFVPILELSKQFAPPEYRSFLKVISSDRCNYYEVGYKDDKINFVHQFRKNIERVEYCDVMQLQKWHFDIHGLIEKGLAIDKSKL